MDDSSQPRPPRFLLKVLSGPHQGAEVGLREGEYLLGSGEECDIVLSDRLLAPRHFKLNVAADGVDLTTLATPLLLSGAPLPEGRRRWTPFDLVTAGATHFVFGPANGAIWPSLDGMKLPSLVAATPPAPPPPGAPALSAEPDASDAASQAPLANGRRAPRPPRRSPMLLPLALAPVTVVALLAFLGWVLWRGLHAPIPDAAAATAVPPAKVDPAQAALDALRRLRFVQRPEIVPRGGGNNGRAAVRGYVSTAAQKREAETAVRGLNVGVLPSIYSEEELLRAGREVLAAYALPSLTLRADGPGVIEAQGRAENAGNWERARASLRQDVPGLLELRDTEVLAGPVSPSRPPPPLAAPAPTVAAAAAPGTPGAAPLRVVSASTGRLGYVTLHNGRKYFVGAPLPGGWTLAGIEPGNALLERREERARVPLGGELPR